MPYNEEELPKRSIDRAKLALISMYRLEKMLVSGHQLIPTDSKIVEKIGLKKEKQGRPNHFFAAFSGEWARALAEKIRIEASDIHKPILEKLKKNKGKIERIFQQAGEYGAIIPRYYNWTISFEPLQLLANPSSCEDVARLALINEKGLKILAEQNNESMHGLKTVVKRLDKIAEVYGGKFKIKQTTITGRKLDFRTEKYLPPSEKNLFVLTLKTNEKARKLAELDLWVERRLNSKLSEEELAEKLSKEFSLKNSFKFSKNDIKESLNRINVLKEYSLDVSPHYEYGNYNYFRNL
ncbi:MAG: hypothetical protein ABH803_00435 [Candidatus Micrarchaeota archaeon]